VTIISGTATRTDALTKSVFIMGPEAGIEFINTLPDVDAVAVAPDGKVFYSKGPGAARRIGPRQVKKLRSPG
jgi:thiamine biosynthesis lipoprotein